MYFFSLSLSVADKRTKGNGITCPTIEWLKSFLLPKLHKWMIEDGAKFSLGQSLRLVSVEKYSKKYEELKQKYKHFVKVMIILHFALQTLCPRGRRTGALLHPQPLISIFRFKTN